MNSLGVTYGVAGQRDRALSLFEETLRRRKATLGLEHPSTLTTMSNLAHAYMKAGKIDRAVALNRGNARALKSHTLR